MMAVMAKRETERTKRKKDRFLLWELGRTVDASVKPRGRVWAGEGIEAGEL